MVLTLLAILVAALAVLAVVSGLVPGAATRIGSPCICALAAVLTIVALTQGGGAELALPVGPLDSAMHLALDPIAASFLLLLFIAMPCAEARPLPLAAMALTVLAGDGFTLAVGLLLLGVARSSLREASLAVVSLVVAIPGGDFAAMRVTPPDGWHSAAVLLLALAGAGALIRVNSTIAIYLLVRVLFDLSGTGQPLLWGVPLVLGGAAIAAIASLRAALADTLHAVLSLGSLHQVGLSAMALGFALFAHAVDLPSVAAQALAAAWLALVCHVPSRTLLLLCADAVEHGAGTRRLDRLGGLIHRMPVTAISCLAGLFAMAVLPPGLGFAAFWLLFQSLLATARFGDLGLQLLSVAAAALIALSAGLAALGAVRLFGVVFLGRPRTPRTAVAEEVGRPLRFILGGLATLITLLGLLPVLALLPAAGWTHAAVGGQILTLRTGGETAGYTPLAIAGLLVVAGSVAFRGLRRSGQRRREPAWSGGSAAPPPWLPFGDPATQYGAASFTEPLSRMVALLRSTAPLSHRLARCGHGVVRAAAALVAP